MAATTTLLGLVTPTQGTLSGTWGDTVNYGISDYVDIAIAGTLSFAGDGAITLANTTGSSAGNAIVSTTAQYMVIRITGTQSIVKIITGPSYSKLYMVDHAGATSAVTFKAAGQSGVSVAVGEKCFVYYNGTDYVKVASSVADGVTSVAMTVPSLLSISGSPITSTGTLALTYSGTALPVANGGTALTAGTSGGVLAYTASGTLASSGALDQYGVVIGGGAGAVPTSTAVGTATHVLTSNGAGVAPTFQAPASSGTVTAVSVVSTNGFAGTSSGGATPALTLQTSISGVLKGNGTAISAATAGTDYVTPTGTETLTNKTIAFGSNTLSDVASLSTAQTFTSTKTFAGSSSALAEVLSNAAEIATVSATAATGTINYDVTTQSVQYFTTNASANWTVNFRASSGTSLNTAMTTGQSVTAAFLVTQGSTAYYNSVVQVDGTTVTPKYQGGTAYAAGNASAVDVYMYTIVKTGSAAFTVFTSQTKFA